jgi:pyruvate/2-oxoglutarate dehydrogenase complex dihydrolipoamide dehydrogenase (E3) component
VRYFGLEFAQVYRRFDAMVTVVEREERVIARDDPDISTAIREILEREGIAVRTGANCIGFARHDRGVSVSATERRASSATASWAMRSVSIRRLDRDDPDQGRRCRTADLGVDRADNPRRSGRGKKGETKGFMKIIADAETRHILGAAILRTGGDGPTFRVDQQGQACAIV